MDALLTQVSTQEMCSLEELNFLRRERILCHEMEAKCKFERARMADEENMQRNILSEMNAHRHFFFFRIYSLFLGQGIKLQYFQYIQSLKYFASHIIFCILSIVTDYNISSCFSYIFPVFSIFRTLRSFTDDTLFE